MCLWRRAALRVARRVCAAFLPCCSCPLFPLLPRSALPALRLRVALAVRPALPALLPAVRPVVRAPLVFLAFRPVGSPSSLPLRLARACPVSSSSRSLCASVPSPIAVLRLFVFFLPAALPLRFCVFVLVVVGLPCPLRLCRLCLSVPDRLSSCSMDFFFEMSI